MRLRRLLRRTDEVLPPPSSDGAADRVNRRRITVAMLAVGAWAFLRRLVSAAEPARSDGSVAQLKPPAPPQAPSFPRPQAPPQGQIPQQQQPQLQQDAANWVSLLNAVGDAVRHGVEGWKSQARVSGITINAAVATGGRVDGPELLPLMRQSPRVIALQGQPRAIVEAFIAGVSDGWGAWQRSLSVPGLRWYPAFAAFPGPTAPPMPNIPTPIVALAQDPRPLAAPNLAAAIRGRLGPNVSLPGAEAALARFAEALSGAVTAWVALGQVMLVMGKGHIPTFAPPYVPVGPVVMGDNVSTPGNFAGAPALPLPPFS